MVNKPDNHGGSLDWTKICERSSKVITFIDLAGHEKYLKTTVFGMTGHLPDFCMLMVRDRGGVFSFTHGQLLITTDIYCVSDFLSLTLLHLSLLSSLGGQ